MIKAELRRELRSARLRFVATLGEARGEWDAAVCRRLLSLLAGTAQVAFYRAQAAEVDVAAALARTADRGVGTALPRIDRADGTLGFAAWRPGDPLVVGPFGLAEPTNGAETIRPDAIVAPLVGFTRNGGRLGQGGGFYDRAFTAFPAARRIGIGWSVQEASALPLDPWDIALHAIVTEREVIEVPA